MRERGKDKEGREKWGSGWVGGGRERVGVRERKRGLGGTGGERERREGRELERMANHEAESAYVTGEGWAAENVMKFSEISGREHFAKASSHSQPLRPRQ